jgi:glucokinase
VVAAALAGDGSALRVVSDFATVMGALAASFALAYLPRAGLWMAGSVARGVLSVPEACAAFLAAFASPQPAVGRLDHQVPLRLIDEDMAALEGCRMLLADTQGPLAGAAAPR